MDNIDLMKHIKDLTSDSMTVFITEPIALEKQVRYIPFTANSRRSFVMEKDGKTQLSWTGSVYARMALENMTNVARFYVASKGKLEAFFKQYQDEYERISKAYSIVAERRHQAKEWHDHAVLIRQEKDIESQREGLFSKMYRTQFGEEAPIIDQQMYEELKNKDLDR